MRLFQEFFTRHIGSLFLFICLLAGLNASTSIQPGNVSGIWTTAGSPYLILGDITIPSGANLQLEPGIQLLFQGYYRLSIEGSLQANGAPGDSILFTSSASDQKWRGLILENIAASNDSTVFNHCIFERGDATLDPVNKNGGALRILNCSRIRIANSRFQNLTALYGGAIYEQASQLRISGCIFKNCSTSSDGGAICQEFAPTGYGSGSLDLQNCLFASNGSSAVGGCVIFKGGNNLVSNCQFYNSNSYQGSALAYWFADGTVSGCLMKGNGVYNGGAGILVNRGNVRISGNSFRDNFWTGYWETRGTGILLAYSNCVIDGNNFANNTSYFGGAGISIQHSTFKIINNLMVNNSATYGAGAITLESWNTGCLIANNTICNNTGTTGGVVVYGYADVINNIIWGNSSAEGQIYARTNGSNQFYDYNCIEGGLSSFYFVNAGDPGWQASQYGEHNVTGNPAFISPSPGAGNGFNGLTANWNLTAGSSCYNAGDPVTDISSYPFDLAGNPRIAENRIDIGAYEFMSPTYPQTPQNLSLELISSNQAVLSWNPVNQAMDGSPLSIHHYQVYSAPGPDGPWTPLGQSFTGQYQISIIEPAQRFFRVSAQTN